MSSCPWVAIDKRLVRTMSLIDRPYSYVEAMFSHSVNVNCGKSYSVNGYSAAWKWSRDKVRKFLEEVNTEEGYEAGKKGTGSGATIQLVVLGKEETAENIPLEVVGRKSAGSRQEVGRLEPTITGDTDDKKTGSRQEVGRKTDTIIKNKELRNNIKEKDTRFDARLFLSARGVDAQHITDWLKTRKEKKLPATFTAFEMVEREAKKAGLTFPEVIKKCCENGWGGYRSSWQEITPAKSDDPTADKIAKMKRGVA